MCVCLCGFFFFPYITTLRFIPALQWPRFYLFPPPNTAYHSHHSTEAGLLPASFPAPRGAEVGLMRQTGQMMLLLLKNIQNVFKTCVMKEPPANKQRVQTGDKKSRWKQFSGCFSALNTCLGAKQNLAAVQQKENLIICSPGRCYRGFDHVSECL